jgi:hypothetical protein
MTHHRGTLAAALILAALALSGCGSDTDQITGVRTAQTVVGGILKSRGPAPAEAGVTRAALNTIQSPVMLVKVTGTGASAVVVPFGSNAGVATWSSVDRKTVSFRQGILVATRGLGDDLMSVIAPSSAEIARGTGNHDRVHYYLNGEDQPERHLYRCTLAVVGSETITLVDRAYATRHIKESCSGPAGRFVNHYWFENGSILRQSSQRIGESLGQLETRRIKD